MIDYLSSLDLLKLLQSFPGGIAQGLIWGIMALGVYITFRLLDIADLTVDGSFATGGAVTVMLVISGVPAPAAILAAVAAGILAGAVTGLLHTVLGIPAILAGILTQFALYSINLRIMDMASNKALSVDRYNLILSSRNITHAIIIGLAIAAVIVCILYWFFGTELGCSMRATGNNPAMSKAQGINISFIKVLGLAFSNGLVALAGGLMAQYQGYSDVKMGQGAIVIGLAAVIIGEVIGDALLRRHMNFFGRLIFVVSGGIIYYIVVNLVLWLKLNSNDLKLFTALIVALFLAVPYLRQANRSSFRRAAKNAMLNKDKEGDKDA